MLDVATTICICDDMDVPLWAVRMPTKECHTTKNTNTSQERNNFSVDMEEESSDMDKVNMYGDKI